MAGPSSKEGFSPFLLPHQPMLHLQKGLTWADPSLWLSPGHFLYILQPCLVRPDEKAPMTHSKDMSLCLGLARHIILQIFSMVRKMEFIASFGGRCDWVDSLSLFLWTILFKAALQIWPALCTILKGCLKMKFKPWEKSKNTQEKV